ncbi:hypothetical protein CQJ30_17230 [Caldibacillus thermoamylovorans]|nr:hypothetical protein CQJ30_17230 [Caldibacillus thermoamylovorans]
MWHKGYSVCLFLHGNYCNENCSTTVNNQNWSKNPEIEKMVWENTEIGFYLTDNIESDYVIDKNIGTNTAA